ncbi:MAG: C25 family cysteine peptidase [Bacteroidales bacterium]|nr:C25 family cysteine peptidase [Bacteroidales bacterium]
MKKLLLTALFSIVLSVLSFAQTVEKVYHFDNPTSRVVNGYDQIYFDGTINTAKVGQPSLPWQSVTLLLPQNSEAQDFTVEYSDFVELDGTYNLFPYQKMRQVGSEKEYPFVVDEDLYESKGLYPEVCQSKVMTQYMNGYSFATVSFTPVRYIPATGKVSYAKTATVKVNVTASKSDKSSLLWATPEIKGKVERLAQNPEAIDQYCTRGRSIPGYELLVITPAEWVSHFDEYVTFYEARGLRTRVAALEDILADNSGRDDQEKMFNYIKQEYENEGFMMVLLGGDVALVPFRGLYVYVSDEDQDNIPADMYFACFDVDWDANSNGVWGEIGESDYMPEIGIGRLCFNNEEQLNNLLHKTFTYQSDPVLGEFHDVILGAEHLGDGYYGSTDLDRLIGGSSDFDYTTVGIPETYNFHKVYADGETGWSGSIFRNAINNYGGGYVHHVGHANTDYVAGWYASGITDGTFNKLDGVTHNYNFFHSHGCICGDFSHGCILEKMTVVSTGFVATTGNSRYGWYAPWGDGPAAHLHREFIDAYYNDRVPYIGTAFVEMKNTVAPYINMGYYGPDPYMIWSFWALNIMGDVAICPWLDEPFVPELRYESALAQGTTETTVTINKIGEAQNNFRCSIFHDGELLAFGMTDENGIAELQFSEPLNVVGEMQLIVTGPNAYPQTINILGINNSTAYIIPENIELSDEFHYADSISMSVDFKNIGNVNVNGVTSTLSTESEYVEILNSTSNVGSVNANETVSVENAFEIGISGNIPDGTYVNFVMESTDGTNVWSDEILYRAMAPQLIINNITYEEVSGNGNDFIEPGEIYRVSVAGRNIGHKTAVASYLHGCEENPYITYTENDVVFGDVEVNGTFEQSLDMIISDETPDGTTVDLKFKAKTGQYAYEKHFIFTVGCVKENFETGDLSHLKWEHSGDERWFVTDNESHTGIYSVQSGEIDNDEISSLIVEMMNTTDGTISFFFKTSTELRKDFLVFYIDNQIQERWSGENDWTFAEFEVKSGNHILEWRYDTSPSGLSEINACWIDDITFPGNTTITDVESITYDDNIAIYPNPARENIIVKSDDIQTVEIFNTVGMKLYSQETDANELNINISELTSGIYFVKIIDSKNNSVVTKFVKK